ncbi:hypothetical protein, partial [Pseudomonas aeruginosa]|uniref:hypothetical protein n=1 Tax=Pseudomonas aeruginosa TaxID=287 RepID=UPI0034E09DD2
MSLEKKDAILFGDGDELPSNHSNNPHMNDLIAGLGNRGQVQASGQVVLDPVSAKLKVSTRDID